jgi:hypothetical protein
MLSGKVAVISIAVETVNLGDADDRAAGVVFTAGSTAVFFFLGAAFTVGRAVRVFFFFGAAFFVFLAMAFISPYQEFLPPGDGSDRFNALLINSSVVSILRSDVNSGHQVFHAASCSV